MLCATDTIAALATPVGTSALAVIRVSGPDTLRLLREIAPGSPRPRVARHVDYRDRNGGLVDDVIVTFFQRPRSYTGEDTLEVSSHGNPFIAQKIVEDLCARGCRPAEPGEFTQRAFLNGRMDLSQAEAVMDLIHARSDRALEAANQQRRGALARRMDAMIATLVGVLARIEAYIDFPEDDLPPEDREFVLRALAQLASETGRLLATTHYGSMLRDGIKTVIVGEPNVGKSTLLNRLVGHERAIVSAEPGTTRDFIEERIMFGPHCLRLIDTAGINHSPAPLEKLGIDKTKERVGEADLLLVVVDATKPASHSAEIKALAERENALLLFNKSDLCDVSSGPSLFDRNSYLLISAATGGGNSRTERADCRARGPLSIRYGRRCDRH